MEYTKHTLGSNALPFFSVALLLGLVALSVRFYHKNVDTSSVSIVLDTTHLSQSEVALFLRLIPKKTLKQTLRQIISSKENKHLSFSDLAALNLQMSQAIRLAEVYGYISATTEKLTLKVKPFQYRFLLRQSNTRYIITQKYTPLKLNEKEYRTAKNITPYFSIIQDQDFTKYDLKKISALMDQCKSISHFRGIQISDESSMSIDFRNTSFITKPVDDFDIPWSQIKKLTQKKALKNTTVDLRYNKVRIL